jgi:hypothetical protein
MKLITQKHTINIDQNNNKVVIRFLTTIIPCLALFQIQNEKKMLQLLSGISKRKKLNINFPKLISFSHQKHSYTLTREYVEGNTLTQFSAKYKLRILMSCLMELKKISAILLPSEKKQLIQKNPVQMILEMPIYTIIALIKNPREIFNILYLYFKYMTYQTVPGLIHPEYKLCYRDLHSGNIIIHQNNITLIDSEICVMGEAETDLAIISIYYIREIGPKLLLTFFSESLKTNSERINFLRASIYYTIQLLAIQKKFVTFYVEARENLSVIKNIYIPNLQKL